MNVGNNNAVYYLSMMYLNGYDAKARNDLAKAYLTLLGKASKDDKNNKKIWLKW